VEHRLMVEAGKARQRRRSLQLEPIQLDNEDPDGPLEGVEELLAVRAVLGRRHVGTSARRDR